RAPARPERPSRLLAVGPPSIRGLPARPDHALRRRKPEPPADRRRVPREEREAARSVAHTPAARAARAAHAHGEGELGEPRADGPHERPRLRGGPAARRPPRPLPPGASPRDGAIVDPAGP